MSLSDRVKQILSWYGSETPGTRAQLVRLLSSGALEFDGRRCQLERGRGGAGAIRTVDRHGQERLISTVNFVEA